MKRSSAFFPKKTETIRLQILNRLFIFSIKFEKSVFRQNFCLLFTGFLLLIAHPPVFAQISGINTIDSSGADDSGSDQMGVPGKNYLSFSDAVAALSAYGVSGPVTFSVASDTYSEQITIPPIPGASPVDTVTFQSATGVNSDVVLRFAPSTNNWVVRLDGAAYVRFRNMTIENTSLTLNYGRVIELRGNTDIIIEGNILNGRDIDDSMTEYAVIYNDASLGAADNADEIFIYDNQIRFGSFSVYFAGNFTTNETGNDILGNSMENYYLGGVYVTDQDGATVRANACKGKGTNWLEAGITYLGKNGAIIGNQVISRGTDQNFGIEISTIGTPGIPVLVANNMISIESPAATGSNQGIYSSFSDYADFYHNSVYVNTASSTNSYGFYGMTSPASNLNIQNNIFMNISGCGAVFLDSSDPAHIASCDSNDLYSTGFTGNLNFTPYATLTDWQTATSGFDTNSVSLDPGFVSTIDLHLSFANPSLPLNHPVGEVADDFDGDARNAANPYIGADEFVPVATGPENALDFDGINDEVQIPSLIHDSLSRPVYRGVLVFRQRSRRSGGCAHRPVKRCRHRPGMAQSESRNPDAGNLSRRNRPEQSENIEAR